MMRPARSFFFSTPIIKIGTEADQRVLFCAFLYRMLFYGLVPLQRNQNVSLDQSARVTVSISQSTCLGSSFAATQERAGLLTKYFAYTALNAAKSFISARKQVVFTTLEKSVPAASRIAPTFLQHCSAWASMSVPTISPVAGFRAILTAEG